MSLHLRLLGRPGRDNALFVTLDTGQRIVRLLFDCGHCLTGMSRADLANLDHLFFSHLHMDHVCGFDGFFRLTYNRPGRPVMLWGPPGSATILHHRFRGFIWNLHEGESGEWVVTELYPDRLMTARFFTKEAFAKRHDEPPLARADALVLSDPDFRVEAVAMDHDIPSMAYLVREVDHWNVNTGALAAAGLKPGPWLQVVKDQNRMPSETLAIQGTSLSIGEWRDMLLKRTAGDSAAYLTDFRLTEEARERLAVFLKGCRALVCESQYAEADAELAQRMGHLTARQAAELARAAGVERLVLCHVSERYTAHERAALLAEARAIFPETNWPERW